MSKSKHTALEARKVRFLLAEGSDFSLERNSLPQKLLNQGFETLRVFESYSNKNELERLKQLLCTPQRQQQPKLLIIFTSKRAVQAVANFANLVELIEQRSCFIASVGKETQRMLQALFFRISPNVLPLAPVQGLQACLAAHVAAYPKVAVVGTAGGLSEKIISDLNAGTQEKKYDLFCVYQSKVTSNLTETLLRICDLEDSHADDTVRQALVLCCPSGTAVQYLQTCIFENAILQKNLGEKLFFLALSPSAEKAVKLNALPPWHLSCEDDSMHE